jgi:glycogen synthase
VIPPRMEVLLLGPYPPPHGGVQSNVVALRRYLLQHSVPCRVVNLTRHRQPDQDGVFYPKGPLGVLRRLIGTPHTIVHLHVGGDFTFRLVVLGLVCTLLPGSKAVLTLHSGGYPTSHAGKTASPATFRGFVFRRFDRLVAVNPALAEMFVSKFGVPSDRVRIIPPHALPSRIPEVEFPEPIEQFFASHAQVLLSMGWLEPEYDYPLQIRALRRIRKRFPGAGLVIFGVGRLESDLLAEIAAAGCSGHVLIAGDVPHDVALATLARCTLFLRTTHYDGDSISVREALHFGTPVIASDTGMRPPGVILVEMANLDALVEAIERRIAVDTPSRPPPPGVEDNTQAIHDLYTELAASL